MRPSGLGGHGGTASRVADWWPVAFSAAFGLAFVLRTGSRGTDGAFRFSLFDDAMISMRYAQNLAAGDGFRWNPGGGTVEGITNPLWAAVMAVPHALGVDDRSTSLVVALLGVLSVVGCVVVAGRLAAALVPGDPFVPTATRWLVATYYPLLFWSARGMEVGVLSCLVLVVADQVVRCSPEANQRRLVVIGAVAAASTWVRIDAVVPLAVVGTWALVNVRRRAGASVWLGTLLGLVVQTAARWAYFGELLPNTYALKVEGVPLPTRLDRGLEVVGTLGIAHFGALIGLAAIALLARTLAPRSVQLLTGLVAAQVAYTIWVGGDAWEWMRYADRFLVVAAPPLAILAAVGAGQLRRTGRSTLVAVAGGVAATPVFGLLADFDGSYSPSGPREDDVLGLVAPVPVALVLLLATTRLVPARAVVASAILSVNLVAVDQWRSEALGVEGDHAVAAYGEVVRRSTDPDAVIAVVNAGALPYFSQRCSVDLLGKNDDVIAHSEPHDRYNLPGHMKWDYERSIGELRPDLVAQLWDTSDTSIEYLEDLGYVEIADNLMVLADTDRVDVPAFVDELQAMGVVDAVVPSEWEPQPSTEERPCPQ